MSGEDEVEVAGGGIVVDIGCGRMNPEALLVGPLLEAGPLGVGKEFDAAELLGSGAVC